MKKYLIIGLIGVITSALVLITQSSAQAADFVTVAGQTRQLTGTNIRRTTDALVLYTPAFGATTGTNQYGYEATVIDGKITTVADGVGNAAIPSNGAVLSGHGTSRTWLRTYAKVGADVTLPGDSNPPPSGTALYPDATVRTLRLFTIVNSGGKKLLKFPGVTANTGKGPLEVKATRSSSTSTDWAALQTVFYSNGSKAYIPNSLDFYYAGDGHSHWHMRDFDAYELYNAGGQKIRTGEKHGFCFEDNTTYRDWPGRVAGSPVNPVYTHDNVCGVGQPSATSITHGLSVGWSDTYPSSLPDQAIDITGLADGNYKVQITADQGSWIKETNETNNTSWAQIKIQGTTVSIINTGGGS